LQLIASESLEPLRLYEKNIKRVVEDAISFFIFLLGDEYVFTHIDE